MSNGRQVGSIVGSLIAAYFTAGTSYAALAVAAGGAVGGYIGGQLDPTKVQGPRLDDLKVQVSTYGVAIPILYGTERATGNVVWSTDRMERSTTTRSGKGGGSVKNTTYSYYVHMRVVLFETPRDGTPVQIAKILKDGKLIWDASSGISVGSALASEVGKTASMVVYQGDVAQLPDPVEEAYQGGPGSVPAYRRVVSVSLRDVECPGGRIPQFSFVPSNGATITTGIQSFVSVPAVASSLFYGAVKATGVWHYTYDHLGSGQPYRISYSYGEAGTLRNVGQQLLPYHVFPPFAPYPVGCTEQPMVLWAYQEGGRWYLDRINLADNTRGTIYSDTVQFAGAENGRAAYCDATNDLVLLSYSPSLTQQPMILNAGNIPVPVDPLPTTPYLVGVDSTAAHFICMSGGGVLSHVRRTLGGAASVVMPDTAGPTIASIAQYASACYVSPNGVCYVYLVEGIGTHSWIYKIHPATPIDAGSWELLATDPGPNTYNISNGISNTFYCTDNLAIYGPVDQPDNDYKFVRFHQVTTVPVKAKDIIADQCERSGTTAYDVSGIPDSDTLDGYKLASVASARANIEPIKTAFGIYQVDEDGLVKFKKYDAAAVVARVSFDELGYSDGEAGDTMPLLRKQEKDMPRRAVVNYIDSSFDFQPAAEPEGRQVTQVTETLQVNVPIATNSDHAKRIAATVLYSAWRTMNTRTTKVARKYAYASPGDLAEIEYPRGTWKIWRITTTNDTGLLVEWSLEPGDTQLFTQSAVGAGSYPSQQVPPLPPLINMVPGDWPILRDQDDNAGLYVAGEGFSDGSRGYTLWMGDDDASLEERGTVTQSSPIGFAESALGNWVPNMIDGQNVVVVDMGSDILANTTEQLLMTTRANLAAIGADGRWEFIQFLNAYSYGGGRYGLYQLLRGLYGTERFRSTHQVGDKFVLINENTLLRPGMSAAEIGRSKRYRPVALGRSLDSVPSQSFTNHAIGLLPYSPWDARKSKAATNDQTITWQRRSRYSTNSLRGIVPLSETSERYSIEFYTSGGFTTLAGTLTSTTNSVAITSAQQTSFGLTPGGTLYVRIRQVSDVIGVGTPLEAIL